MRLHRHRRERVEAEVVGRIKFHSLSRDDPLIDEIAEIIAVILIASVEHEHVGQTPTEVSGCGGRSPHRLPSASPALDRSTPLDSE